MNPHSPAPSGDVAPASVFTVLDLGARDGLHPRWLRLPVRGIGVESDAAECARLNAQPNQTVRYVPYWVGARDGEQRTFYVTTGLGCCSLLEPNITALEPFSAVKYFRVKRTMPVMTTSLDTLCRVEGIVPTVLKLDTQGTELEILQGGQNALRTVIAVELEVEFLPLYKRQPLFRDVDAWMDSQGFTLMGLRRDIWRRTTRSASAAGGQLAHADALYYDFTKLNAAAEETRRILFSAYAQHDMLGPLAPKPTWWHRIVGELLWQAQRRWGQHKDWRARLDAYCSPRVTDWHDPQTFF